MKEVTERQFTISTEDRFPLAATVFSASSTSSTSDKVIVMASGLGVPRYAYYKFARFLALNGYSVITFDYRGIFESEDPQFAPSEMKMEEWGRQDIEAVLQFARNELNASELYYIGHSAGGQLVGLAPSSVHLDAAVFLSAVVGYWKLWPARWKWGIFLFWYILPVLTWNRAYFPAKLVGFSSIDIPSGVVRQWSRWGRSPNYLFDHIRADDLDRYKQFNMALLAITFDDDTKLGPKRPADKLLTYFKNAEITRKHINPEDYSASRIEHFGFFKKKFESSLWKEVLRWLKKNSS